MISPVSRWFEQQLPAPLTIALKAVKQFPAALQLRRRLDAASAQPAPGGPALHYGGVPGLAGAGFGGAAKLRLLAAAFPESYPRFNVLYLVSSALPPLALPLVRWAKARGVRFVYNQNGVGYRAWAGRQYARVINHPMSQLVELADHVLYQSAFCRQTADLFIGRAECPHEILYNAVDTEFFSPPESRLPGPIRLLVAGSHHQSQRVLVPIRALARLCTLGMDARLHIAGRLLWPGADMEVRRTAGELGVLDRIEIEPAYGPERARAIYQGADVLLHIKHNDPCPSVVIEAMACGVPIVGSGTGGLPELVPGSAGILVPADGRFQREDWPRSSAVAAAVQEVCGSLEAYAASARANAVARFDSKHWLARHREVFLGLAARK